MGKKTPKAPDYGSMIDAQTKANQINQYTPGGTVEYGSFDKDGNFVPAADRTSARVTESAGQKGIRTGRENLAQSLLGGLDFSGTNNGVLSPYQLQYGLPNVSQFTNNLPGVGTGSGVLSGAPSGGDIGTLNQDYADANARAANAVYQRGYNMVNPDLELQQKRTEADLAARGIPVGSDAYSAEKDRLSRNRSNTLENLGLSAITAGNQEAGRLYGQDLSTFNAAEGQRANRVGQGLSALTFDEQQRQNRMNEQIAQLQAQLAKQGFIQGAAGQNEQTLQSRANLAAALGSPNTMFINPAGVDAAGLMNSAYQNQLAGQQARAGNLLGLGQLGLGIAGLF
jgi:uncharacterized protein YcgL (UPF0745 family)